MAETLTFQPDDQSEIAKAAGKLFDSIKSQLPRVPWFSNSGQQDAFHETVRLIIDSASKLDADFSARKAIIFWVLTVLYANKRSFRLATASIKNWGSYGIHPIASTFVSWIGDDSHPGQVVAAHMDTWENDVIETAEHHDIVEGSMQDLRVLTPGGAVTTLRLKLDRTGDMPNLFHVHPSSEMTLEATAPAALISDAVFDSFFSAAYVMSISEDAALVHIEKNEGRFCYILCGNYLAPVTACELEAVTEALTIVRSMHTIESSRGSGVPDEAPGGP